MIASALQEVYDRAPIVALADLLGLKTAPRDASLLIIAPHPDDESLGCGGLIASAVAEGVNVNVVILTDGEASHPASRKFPAARLGSLRRQETANALHHLGADAGKVAFYHLKDGGVPFSGELFATAVEKLAALCRQNGISVIFCTSGLDPHPDHKAAFAIASALRETLSGARLWAYPIWSWTLSQDRMHDSHILMGCRLDISQYLDLKREAIEAHVSQVSDLIDDDPNGFRLDARFISRFLEPYELYISC